MHALNKVGEELHCCSPWEHMEQDKAQAAAQPLFPPPSQLFPLGAPAIFIVELHREHRAVPCREWDVSAGKCKYSRAGTFFTIIKESCGERSSVICALLSWASLSRCWFMESFLRDAQTGVCCVLLLSLCPVPPSSLKSSPLVLMVLNNQLLQSPWKPQVFDTSECAPLRD